jgi:hypothetical protein
VQGVGTVAWLVVGLGVSMGHGDVMVVVVVARVFVVVHYYCGFGYPSELGLMTAAFARVREGSLKDRCMLAVAMDCSIICCCCVVSSWLSK